MIKHGNLESFLKLGYFLDYKNPDYSFNFGRIDKQKYESLSINELIDHGSEYFIKAVEKLYRANDTHVVPISGGLDSRAVLAALLEFTSASNIHTYTFGTPGTLDFEIGNQIARGIGTQHTNFPLTEYHYNMDELIDISFRVDHQTVLFHHPPVAQINRKYGDSTIWSGFFGDPLVGSHFIPDGPKGLGDAKKLFLSKNEYQKSVNLSSNENLLDKYIETNTVLNNKITTFELLDFYNRQLKFVAPHVLMKGFNYSAPFLDEDLCDFFLSVDDKYRKDQFLYKRILLYRFPELFSYPVKNNLGLSLKANKASIFSKRVTNKLKRTIMKKENQNVNYLDFGLKIREKNDLREIVRSNINDLYQRETVDRIDIRQLYEKHIKSESNYGKALILLTSLEIHLKSMGINS